MLLLILFLVFLLIIFIYNNSKLKTEYYQPRDYSKSIDKVHKWVRHYFNYHIRKEFDKLIQLNCGNGYDDAYEDY
jgi:hypothetical protein